MKHSSFYFKLHKNERTKKEWGVLCTHSFMQQYIESSTNLASVSHLYQMGGLSIASESCHSYESLYSTDWLLFQSSMVFGVCFIEAVLPGHIIRFAKSLEIVCLESISYIILCTISHVSILLSLLWSLNHLPLFRLDWWRIPQCLPLTDFFLSTSAHHPGMKSRNLSILWYHGSHFHYRWLSSQLLVVFTIDH